MAVYEYDAILRSKERIESEEERRPFAGQMPRKLEGAFTARDEYLDGKFAP